MFLEKLAAAYAQAPKWRETPASDAQRWRLRQINEPAELAAAANPTLTKGEASDLIGNREPCDPETAALLRFFGLNPDAWNQTVSRRHARTLMQIPKYAARWDEALAQRQEAVQRFLDAQAKEEAASAACDDEALPDLGDEIESMFSEMGGIALDARLRIVYVNAEGRRTPREITLRRATRADDSGAWYLDAYCHVRREERTFLSDRVESAVDLTTGEVIASLDAWLLNQFRLMDDIQIMLLDRRLEPALRILLYMGRADGRLEARERAAILDYARHECDDLNLTADQWSTLDDRLKRQRPDRKAFRDALRNALSFSPRGRAALVRATEAVMTADGKIHDDERRVLGELTRFLA